jgi:hypothetical protein
MSSCAQVSRDATSDAGYRVDDQVGIALEDEHGHAPAVGLGLHERLRGPEGWARPSR